MPRANLIAQLVNHLYEITCVYGCHSEIGKAIYWVVPVQDY